METLLKADIFFVVTTITVLVIAVLVITALIYIVRILRDFKNLSESIKDEGSKIVSDVDKVRKGFFKIFKKKK